MEDIELKPIIAPELKESDYGKNINNQFENIDNNFKLVSNRDFVKGDSGESLYIENVKITKDGKGIEGELYEALKTAIEKNFSDKNKSALKPVDDYNWDDAVTSTDGGLYVPIIASKDKTTDTAEYICAASPVMLFDNRFNENAIENVNFSNYEDVVDVTSILNFKKEGGEWKCELNLSYPRLQYKDGSFHWVINNENTIVKSTGIKGDPGESTNIWIVQTLEYSENYDGATININKYFVGGKWINSVPENIKDGDLAIVYCESENKDYYGFFVAQIKLEEGNNTIVYNPKANIQNINYEKNTTEFFKSLGKDGAARGMFLKFYPNSLNSTDSHIFYNENENLHIKPINDFSSVEDYNKQKHPSINIAGYHTTNINSKKINISASEDIEIIRKDEQQGHIKLASGCQMSMTSKEGMDLMDDTRILIKSKNISVTGTTELRGGLTVVNGGLNVADGGLTISNSGKLTVTGTTELQNGLIVTKGGLNVTGTTELKGDLTVSNSGKLTVTGITELQNGLTVTKGGLTVTGTTELKGDLKVTTGNTSLDGSLTVTGEADLQNGLKVTSGTFSICDANGEELTIIDSEDGIQKITLPKSCEVDLKINPTSWDRSSINEFGESVSFYQLLNSNKYYKINIEKIYQQFEEDKTLFDGGVFRAELANEYDSAGGIQTITYNLVIDGFPESSITYFGLSTILQNSSNYENTYIFNIYFGKTSGSDVSSVKIYEINTKYKKDYNKRILFSILTDSDGDIITYNHYDVPHIYDSDVLDIFTELE